MEKNFFCEFQKIMEEIRKGNGEQFKYSKEKN